MVALSWRPPNSTIVHRPDSPPHRVRHLLQLRSVDPWIILELLVDCHDLSKLLHLGNLVHVKPDSHLSWTLPSVEDSSISFEYLFQDWLQAKCSCRATTSCMEPPATFWPKRIFWRSSSLKSPPNMKAAVSSDEELNLIIFEHVFVS